MERQQALLHGHVPVGRRELSLEISHYFGEHVRAFGKEEITNTSVAKFFFLVKMTSIKKAEELIEFEATPKQCASAVIQLLNQLLDDL